MKVLIRPAKIDQRPGLSGAFSFGHVHAALRARRWFGLRSRLSIHARIDWRR